MIRLRLDEVATMTGGRALGSDVVFEGIVCDSRLVQPGVLFAALPGERVDGHAFAESAVQGGAAALLVGHPLDVDAPQVVTPDVLKALGSLARAWRERLDPLVVGITGSNGKTTTRAMITRILERSHAVLATSGNFNNELGLPLTLFHLNASHRVAVLEMGASRAGDIAYLAGIGQPDIGLITNVGPAHLQGFGDERGVALAKGEIYAALPPEGWAIINGDEPWSDLWTEMATARNRLTFGMAPACDVRAEAETGRHRVVTPSGSFELQLALPGIHNLQNALAATAAALAADVPLDDIRAGLEATRPVPGRLNLLHARGGWTVIDDTYNANPASLYAALQVLAGESGEPWLVLGDMKELGPASRKLHAEMGDAARSLGVRRLYALGEASVATVDAFGGKARHYSDLEALLDDLVGDLHEGVTCLVKGSRSMGMERVVRVIAGAEPDRETH